MIILILWKMRYIEDDEFKEQEDNIEKMIFEGK
jgi:hypothetical protein